MIYDSPDSKHVSYIQTNKNVSQFTDQRLHVTFDYMGNIEDMVKILNYNPCLGQNYANSTSSKKCQSILNTCGVMTLLLVIMAVYIDVESYLKPFDASSIILILLAIIDY